MLTRTVGHTGIEATIIGLGSEHLDGKPRELVDEVIGAALDHGMNIMDLFMPGDAVRTNIGRALKGKRDKMFIQGAIGSVDLREQYDVNRELATCRFYFENLLSCLETDYIDFGMLFFMDSHDDIDAMLDNGVVEYAGRLRQAGVIRAVGASVHNPETARRLVEEGLVEMLLFSINPAFDLMAGNSDITTMLGDGFGAEVSRIDPRRAELYRLCQSREVGITVMKTYGAGKLFSPAHSPFAQALTPGQCIHYALTRPAVSSVLIGCRSRQEVEAAVAYLDLSEKERDYSQAISLFKGNGKGGFAGACLYCNHCLPCPAEINIASVNKYLDIARLDENDIPAAIALHYRELEAHGSDCIACGSCEKRCPFGVKVMDNMREAARLFDNKPLKISGPSRGVRKFRRAGRTASGSA
jgi:predicted aldo/keto reductase-like oxidoreductase